MNARYGQSATWQRAEEYFARRGGIAIVLTRCVLMPIAVPVNLVAGSSEYPVWRFAAYDVSGELIWLLGYGALGYLFGSQWGIHQRVHQYCERAAGGLAHCWWRCLRPYPLAAPPGDRAARASRAVDPDIYAPSRHPRICGAPAQGINHAPRDGHNYRGEPGVRSYG